MLLLIAEYLGIAAFAASGFYIAVRNRLDLLGIYLSSFLTALGGGILRDLLAGHPPYSLTHGSPSYLALAVTTVLILLRFHRYGSLDSKRLFVLIDAVGMASFAVSGALTGLASGFSAVGVTLLSFVTAVGGGIMRDVLINRVPYLLHGGFYGIIALSIGMGVCLLSYAGAVNSLTMSLLFLSGVVLRMIAYHYDWHLPRLGR